MRLLRFLTLTTICIYTCSNCSSLAQSPSFPQALKQAEEATRKRDWQEAAKLWEKVVEANPVNADYWQECGSALHSAKEYRKAISAFEKALEMRAGYPFNTAYNIACCFALLGEKEIAFKWLQKSLDMGFRNLLEMKLDTDLETLRSDDRFKKLAGIFDTSKMTREEGWRTDLAFLHREIKRKHFDPYRQVTREQMDAYVDKLNGEIPNLNDYQIMVRFIRLMKMAGDGHTSIRPAEHKGAPVQFYLFSEGLFITATTPEQTQLLGARVLKIGSHPIEGVLKGLEPYVARDNDMGMKSLGPVYMRMPRMLYGMGLLPSPSELPMTIQDASGNEKSITLPAESGRPDDTWIPFGNTLSGTPPLYLKNRNAPYWFEYLADRKSVFFQYNAVQNDPKEPLDKFCDRLFKFINENDVEKLVLDLRWNGGGNTFLNQPIIHGIIKCDKINQKGKLFAIIGRQTFSAAQNCVVFLERNTKVTFVGEPSGSSPNFIGETVRVTLPYSKMTGSISDLYWQSSWPMDYRTWIAPTLYVPPTFAAYKSHTDPALEAVLAYLK